MDSLKICKKFCTSNLNRNHLVCIISFQEKLWYQPNGWGQLMGSSLFQCVILVDKNKDDCSGALEQNHTLVELRL